MIAISKCRRKSQLMLKYCIQISNDDFCHPKILGELKLRSFNCLCPQSSWNILTQIESNHIKSLGRLSITTILPAGTQDVSEKTHDLNIQLFQSIKASNVEEAFKCLQGMHSNCVPIRCHYFWPLIIQMHVKHGEPGVIEVLDKMLALEVSLDYDTCVHYLCPRLNLSNPLLAIRKLQDRNLKMQQILTPICISLLQNNQIREVTSLCFEKFPQTKLTHADFISALVEYYINTDDVENTVQLLNRAKNIEERGDLFLTHISQSKNPSLEVEKVQLIITELIKAGINFSSNAVYDLKVFFTKHGLVTSNFLFYQKTTRRKPPRLDVDRPLPSLGEMNTSELEYRLISMKSRDLDPSSVLKRLFFKYCQEKKYDKARQVKKELQQCRVQFTLGMQSTCIDLHIHYLEAEEAESVLSHLRETNPSFQVDEYKILDLARVYAQQGQYQKALKLVSSIRPRANLNQKLIERNCKELLSSIQDEGFLLSTFKVLCESKLCAGASTPILSTIIRHFLNTNNVDKAVTYFERFSSTLRKTPLKHELLLACLSQVEDSPSLAQQKTPENLSIVLNAISKVHGVASCSIAYITALAELGRHVELRSYVKEELQIAPEFLTKMSKQIQRLGDENKSDSLNLLRDLLETNETLVDHIYLALLQIYCRKDNNEEIKRLKLSYERIKTPSEEFSTIVNSRLKIKPLST